MESAGPLLFMISGYGVILVGFAIGRLIRSRRDLETVDGTLTACRPRLVTAMNLVGAGLVVTGSLLLAWRERDDRELPSGFAYCFATVILTYFVWILLVFTSELFRPEAVIIGSDGVAIQGFFRRVFVGWQDIETDPEALYDAGLRGIPTTQPVRKKGRIVYAKLLDVGVRKIVTAITFYRLNPSARTELEPVNGYGELYRVG
jgi:hypothetical protein